jgi:phage head maturation protease
MKEKPKLYVLKDAAFDGNKLRGVASVMGNLDNASIRDVIYPIAFGACLTSFLAAGFVADSHDWSKMVAMPLDAHVDGNALVTESEFHSTPDAQDLRTKCMERMANGLAVGLSIGFSIAVGGCRMFANGDDLLAHAREMGCDMSLFDVAGISAWKSKCRGIWDISDLYEYSIVSVPANPLANATDVKNLNAEFKSQYLGAYLEQSMTMAALRRLDDALFYNVLYDLIYGNYVYNAGTDEYEYVRPPLDEALVTLEATLQEFATIFLRTYKTLMTDVTDEQAIELAKSIRTLWPNPSEALGDLPARAPYADQLTSALAAVKGCIERGVSIKGIRAQDQRTLSSERVDQIKSLRDALEGLTLTEVATDSLGGLRARIAFELSRAQQWGVALAETNSSP